MSHCHSDTERKKNMKLIIKKLVSIFTGLMTFTSLILIFTEKEIKIKITFLILFLIFGILTYQLIKKIKGKNKKVISYIPNETLNDLKHLYEKSQIDNLVRIIQESYKIMENTKNIEILCERYNVGMQNINTLKELEIIKEYNLNPSADYFISLFTSNYYSLILKCYDRYLGEVKTKDSKKTREEKFWITLAKYVDEYTLQDIKDLNK